MKVVIYSPAKTAMQSGKARTGAWEMEFVPVQHKRIEPLMGWTSTDDTTQQVRMRFDTLEQAVAYAKANGHEYVVRQPHARKLIKKSYADNFAYHQIQASTEKVIPKLKKSA